MFDRDDSEAWGEQRGCRRVQAGVRRVQVDDAEIGTEPPQHPPVLSDRCGVPEPSGRLHERDLRRPASPGYGFGDRGVRRDDRDPKRRRQAGEDRREAVLGPSHALCIRVRDESVLSRHQPAFAIRAYSS